MKTDIHPEYVESHVRCSCGNTFTTRSTKGELHVELCNECHPYDSAGTSSVVYHNLLSELLRQFRGKNTRIGIRGPAGRMGREGKPGSNQ